MTLHRIASQGLGHGVEPNADQVAIEAALLRLIGDRGCRLRAENFGRTYDGYQPDIAVTAIADAIEGILKRADPSSLANRCDQGKLDSPLSGFCA